MNRGKFVIVMMLVVGVSLASFAWWHRWRASQQVLSHWGPAAADAIRLGEKVELLRLARPAESSVGEAARLSVGGQDYAVISQREITQVPGLIHARHHLLHERGLAWNRVDAGTEPSWDFALRFTKGDTVATLVLDFAAQRVRLLQRDEEVSMAPIASALQQFIADIMPTDASATATPATSPE